MEGSRRSFDSPQVSAPDVLEVKAIESPFRFDRSPDPRLSAAIVTAVNRMGGTGDDAEALYRRSLEELYGRAEEVVRVVAEEYEALDESAYLARWSLVLLVAELHHPAALEFFDRVLSSDMPPERSRNPHSFSTLAEEVMIRTTAVEGLQRLAAEGHRRALDVLLGGVRHPQFSVRRASAQALLETDDEEVRRHVREALSELGEERILDIRRTDVRNARQAEGGRFLAHPDSRNRMPPPELDKKRP